MTKREQFVNYVKNGGRSFASPQIGCGAGFDTKMAGREWISETTVEDTIAACQAFDMVPLYNFGLPDAGFCDPALAFQTVSETGGAEKHTTVSRLVTPVGKLTQENREDIRMGVTPTKFPVADEDDLKVLGWYLDRALETDLSPLTAHIQALSDKIGGDGALSFQWGAQPYELLSWPSTVDTALLAMDCPELFTALMDKIVQWDLRLMDCCAAGGADFIFLGGPAAEMISPAYYEEFIVPYSQIVTAEAHRRGLLVYTHICSPIEPMLTRGYYNQMGIDLFETLSEPPVGNVKSIEDAFDKLDASICTRGNLGLDVMLRESEEEIARRCHEILEKAEKRGRKHILAASDYLFYDTPEANVHAMCRAAREF